jgi:hypothetical protein
MNRLNTVFIVFIFLFSVARGLGCHASVFAADRAVSGNENDSMYAPPTPLDEMPAVLTTAKNAQDAARFNRLDDFCCNQDIKPLLQNTIALAVPQKNLQRDIKNTISIKLRN